MKAVVMAGGQATRLRPLTTAINKHMLPVYDRPMIQRNIETLVASGITEIRVLLNNTFAQPVMELLEHGEKLGAHITYGYERSVVSVGKHIAMAEKFIGDEPFILYLGDSFYRHALDLRGVNESGAFMWVMSLGEDDDFRKYAEVELDDTRSRVIDIIAKPTVPKTGMVQTGAWIFPPDVFARSHRLIKTVEGEVQVRTIVAEYVKEGSMYATVLPPGSFLDLGTPEALHRANVIAREEALLQK